MLKEPNIGNILFNRRYFYYYPRYQSYNQQKRYWPYRNYYNRSSDRVSGEDLNSHYHDYSHHATTTVVILMAVIIRRITVTMGVTTAIRMAETQQQNK